MTSKLIKAGIAAAGLLFVLALAGNAQAQQNPFGMSDLKSPKVHVATEKCAPGKCGASMDMSGDNEGSGDMPPQDNQGDDNTPPKSGKCGDGKTRDQGDS